MGSGYAPFAALGGAGIRIDSSHFILDTYAWYDNDHKSERGKPNPKGHDRGLVDNMYYRLPSGWAFGGGTCWSQHSTSNYTKSSWRSKFGGSKDALREPARRLSASIFSPIVSESDSVDPNAFIAEVYRRMSARRAAGSVGPDWREMEDQAMVLNAVHQYAPYLPEDRTAPILDLGFGSGWFLAACLKLGYEKIYGADFRRGQQAARSRLGTPSRSPCSTSPLTSGSF
jgi:hypothetical protein